MHPSDQSTAVAALRAERRHLLAALDAMDVAVVVFGQDLQVLHCNAVAAARIGFDPVGRGDEVAVVPDHETFHEDGTPWPLAEWPHRRALATGALCDGELMEHRGASGSEWVRVSALPLHDDDDEASPYAAIGIFRNVTRQRERQAVLAESEAHFRLLAENAGDLITRHTVDGFCTYASPSALELFAMQPAELLGDWRNSAAVHEDDIGVLVDLQLRLIETAEPFTARYRAQHRDGRWIWVETVSRPVVGVDGRVVEIQSATRDITARVDQEQRLARLALTDTLSGLPNRAALTQFLEDQIDALLPVAVLFLDLDRFKVVNDSLGHSAGDELLRTVAVRLSSTCRDGDMVARLGGDEFVLVTAGLDEEASVALADRVQRVLASPVTISGHELVISASVGIVLSDPSGSDEDAEGLLRDADVAMYRAKANGRARAVVWTKGLGEAAVHRFGVEGELRIALEQGQLVVFYQPQVMLSSGRIAGVEALVRWQHPTRGLLAPGEFLRVADESGLVVELGRQVLSTAVSQVVAWRHLPGAEDLGLSVNVSEQELLDPGRLHWLLATVDAAGLPRDSLTVEVLESVLFDEEGAMRTVLQEYSRAGLCLALDDFGTGSTALAGLRHAPIGALKIDRAFVSGIGASVQDEAIVRAIRSLSADLGLTCIAEGVEEETQRGWLAEQGVEYAQGYLLHRPLPADEMEALLRAGQTPPGG